MDHVDQMVGNVTIPWISSWHVLILLTIKSAKHLVFAFVGKKQNHLEKIKTKFLVEELPRLKTVDLLVGNLSNDLVTI